MAIIRKTLDQIKPISQSELDRLASMPDSEIDYSDMPEWTAEQIANAKRGKEVFSFMNSDHYKPTKQQVTLRLDSDILAWLKKDGKGYQTRANELLRQMMIKDIATA